MGLRKAGSYKVKAAGKPFHVPEPRISIREGLQMLPRIDVGVYEGILSWGVSLENI